MEAKLSFEKINEFINKNCYAEILNFDEKTSELIFGEGKDSLILFINPNDRNYYKFNFKIMNNNI